MKLPEAQQQFIQAWGTLGSNWGINRAMAQIHALLIITPDSLTTEEIMDKLQISRGNANMNLRELINWGLIRKVLKAGQRKEYFEAEKQVWKIARQVARERKKRELEPILKVLDEVSKVEGNKKDPEYKTFTQTIQGIRRLSKHADKTLDIMIKAEENAFFGTIIRSVL
jgi:DNA-binding transcriptional regulator GbsR (MarR family)